MVLTEKGEKVEREFRYENLVFEGGIQDFRDEIIELLKNHGRKDRE